MQNRYKFKKILIMLYETFDGDYSSIAGELLERKIQADEKSVNAYIKEHNLKISDYIAFFDSKFPMRFRDCYNPILIIKKSDDILPYLNKIVHPLDISVKELFKQMDIDFTINKRQFKKICQINNYQVDTL